MQVDPPPSELDVDARVGALQEHIERRTEQHDPDQVASRFRVAADGGDTVPRPTVIAQPLTTQGFYALVSCLCPNGAVFAPPDRAARGARLLERLALR